MKIRFKQWLHPQMGVVPVDPKTPLVLEAEIEREWVGLTEKDFSAINQSCLTKLQAATSAESILKEKNT
jgi:hypothetical protein